MKILKLDSKHRFPSTKSFGGYLIRWFQGTNYTHYAIQLDPASFFDASLSGVRRKTGAEFYEGYRSVGCWKIEANINRDDFLEWFSGYEGKKYGLLQVFGLGLKIISSKLFKSNPFINGSNRVICNELVLDFLVEFNLLSYPGSLDEIDLLGTEAILKTLESKKVLGAYECLPKA